VTVRPHVGRAVALTLAVVWLAASPGLAAEPLRLHAAGSLREALTEVASAFTRATGIAVDARYGASGLLRERLERGEPGDVFASADVGNPRELVAAGKARNVVVFTRNRLCAVGRPGLEVTPDSLLDRLLDPAITVGTSTPGADPAGDYAWQMFSRAEAVRRGARATLEAKARQLTGGGQPSSVPASGRGVYTDLIAAGNADVMLTYCTNAAVVQRHLPDVRVVVPPPALAVEADYGATALLGPRTADALAFVNFFLSPEGQAIFERHGFARPTTAGAKSP
jgi:ABC-type molybdate transport system substrate-binding protein